MNPEQQQICNKTEINSDLNRDEGRYIYCVIGASEEKKFVSPPIGGRGDEVHPIRDITDAKENSKISNGVHSISYRDIAAVISVSAIKKYSISRENTMAHQKVLEELMRNFTVLPVKFGTVAGGKNGVSSEKRIREEVLKARHEELKDLLIKMNNKIELGLKAFWTDMKVIFQEIVDENSQIKKLRQKLALEPITQPFGGKATLGEMVKDALERKKAKEEKDILDVLKNTCVDWRSNKVFGDNMITNSSFLVEKSKVEEFDRLVDKLATTYEGRTKFKYVGPVPPINFVELVITLKD
ncbi:GvpL/GvpF family gas vesicle protein [bacterium]|nr:GvpL/GvpF family gas vesicle protein [bacterium]MBU1599433.1 GvpL/GvpF family gas vesicle protein [bacterium]